MSRTVQLPRLELARDNFASSAVGVCNRVFAIYQVDHPDKPFWVVEIDVYQKPVRAAWRYRNHIDAVQLLSELAQGALGHERYRHTLDTFTRVPAHIAQAAECDETVEG